MFFLVWVLIIQINWNDILGVYNLKALSVPAASEHFNFNDRIYQYD